MLFYRDKATNNRDNVSFYALIFLCLSLETILLSIICRETFQFRVNSGKGHD